MKFKSPLSTLTPLSAAVLTGAVLLGSSLAGSAATLTVNSNTISATGTDWVSTLVFPQFNPLMGTLQSVEMTVGSTIHTVLTVRNTDGALASLGYAKTEVYVSVQDVGHNLPAPQLDLVSPQYDFSLNAGQSVTSGTITKSGLDTQLFTDAPILAAFTGDGNVSLDARTLTNTLISYSGGNTSAVQVTTAGLTGTVTYTYLVPESSSALLGGLGALALLRRRRR